MTEQRVQLARRKLQRLLPQATPAMCVLIGQQWRAALSKSDESAVLFVEDLEERLTPMKR